MTDRGFTRSFGFVLFDEPDNPKDGFAALAGKRPAFRISGVNELSSDVIWWTNVPFDAFYKKTETWRCPWLRHDKYLVISPREALLEWAVDPKTVAADFAACLAADVFDRVMKMAFRLIMDVEPRAKMENVFQGKFLREDLRRLLPEAEYPKGEAASIMKSGNAWQEFTRTTVPGIRGGRLVTLRCPRLAYAHEMLQTPIPRGPFEFYGRSELRSVSRDKARWVAEQSNPCMIEISVNKIDGNVAPIYGYGNATDKDRRIARSWVSHPEFIVMQRFADIDVKSMYMGAEYDLIGPALPEPVRDFLTDKYSESSWSAGVIAETLWRAAALAEEAGKAQGGEDRAHTSWQGAWLKGADKTNTFLYAMQLTERGYGVVSYGLGWLRVGVLEEQIGDLLRDALSLGLVPQIMDVIPRAENERRLFSPGVKIPWGGDEASRGFAQLIASGNRDLLWQLDRVCLMPPSQRKAATREILLNYTKSQARS